MGAEQRNEFEVDRLLKQVLKDDLPSAVEFRMRKRLAAFRSALASAEEPKATRALRLRLPLPERLSLPSWPFRREVLAYVSAVMLVAGAVMHLGGYQNLLANSISLLKTSMSLSEQVRRASSMDCMVRMTEAGSPAATYRIRWARNNRTRIDLESLRGIEPSWWVSQGQMTVVHVAAGTRETAADPPADLREPVRSLLSPADLARRLDRGWQLQAERKQPSADRLLFIDRQDRAVIEIHFDRQSFLPVSLTRRASDSGGNGGRDLAHATAEFIWNQPIAQELLVPRVQPGK